MKFIKNTHAELSPCVFDPGPGPGPPDWTVLVALVVSISGFALLVLLIYGIIFCYKCRKGKGTFLS